VTASEGVVCKYLSNMSLSYVQYACELYCSMPNQVTALI